MIKFNLSQQLLNDTSVLFLKNLEMKNLMLLFLFFAFNIFNFSFLIWRKKIEEKNLEST